MSSRGFKTKLENLPPPAVAKALSQPTHHARRPRTEKPADLDAAATDRQAKPSKKRKTDAAAVTEETTGEPTVKKPRKEARREWFQARLLEQGGEGAEGAIPAPPHKGKKRAKPEADSAETSNTEENGVAATSTDVKSEKTKERRKRKRVKPPTPAVRTVIERPEGEEVVPVDKKKKYVVFVGNLPFDSTKEQIEDLFKKCEPIVEIRMLTKRGTNEFKGCAFVEFSNSASMHKALLYHKQVVNGRKMNVEMTAGGGGNKSEARKLKIQKKNEDVAAIRKKWVIELKLKRPAPSTVPQKAAKASD